MSNIFNQLLKSRIEQFNNCKPYGAGKYDVKPGHLLIQQLHPTPVGINGEVLLCDANWKPNAKEPFFSGQAFKMNVDMMYTRYSLCRDAEKVHPTTLIGKQINTFAPRLTEDPDRSGKILIKYGIEWNVSNDALNIVTPQNAGMYVFAGDHKTTGDACAHFYSTSDASLSDALYYEGLMTHDYYEDYGTAYEAPDSIQ